MTSIPHPQDLPALRDELSQQFALSTLCWLHKALLPSTSNFTILQPSTLQPPTGIEDFIHTLRLAIVFKTSAEVCGEQPPSPLPEATCGKD